MAAFYADENVAYELVQALRALGHDVLRAFEDGRANQQIDDPDVMARSIELGRTVVTNNRYDYHRLHRIDPNHCGIVTYTKDLDYISLASRIDSAIAGMPTLVGQLVKVIKPSLPRRI